MTNADANSNAIPIGDWLKFVDREYLSTFIKDGGASVKFAVVADESKPRLYSEVKALGANLGYALVDLDAARIEMRAYMPQDVFFGIASQLDWRLMARRMVLSMAAENGYRADGLDSAKSGSLIDAIANANGLDPAFVRTTLNPVMQDRVFRDANMARDFRVAMTHLCLLSQAGDSQEGGPDQPLIDWLTGANTRIGNVRPFNIRARIDRSTARYFIQSALYWARLAGYSGTVILLDNSRVMQARRPRPPDGKRYYTKAMTVDHYELLREFIDEVDTLSSALLIVVTDYEFLDDQSSRGWGIYQALQYRLIDDVRDKNLVNPAASLVRLS